MSVPKYAVIAWERDKANAREARRTAEALMLAKQMEASIDLAVMAGPSVRVGDYLIPTDSSDDEYGTTILLPADEVA